MPEDEQVAAQTPTGRIVVGEDYSEDYANNFLFESTAWDFKIIFGQFDQMRPQAGGMNWHTSVTMPWGVVKGLSYYLLLSMVGQELQQGRIQIPNPASIPDPPVPAEDTPDTQRLYKLAKLLHRWVSGAEDFPFASIFEDAE